jgi:hypothetical protein
MLQSPGIFAMSDEKETPSDLLQRPRDMAQELLRKANTDVPLLNVEYHQDENHPGSIGWTTGAMEKGFRLSFGRKYLENASDTQLEGVIGHEIGHLMVAEPHSDLKKKIKRTTTIGLVATSVACGATLIIAIKDRNPAMGVMADGGMEYRCDKISSLLTPEGVIPYLQLEKSSTEEYRVSWLSNASHPSPWQRQENIERFKASPEKVTQWREKYLRESETEMER